MENRETAPHARRGWVRRHATTLLLVVVAVLIVPAGVQAASTIVQITDGSGKNIADVDSTGTLHVRAASDLAPFQRTISIDVPAGEGNTGTETITRVPAGQRLVLDFASGWAEIRGCSSPGDYLTWISARLDPIHGSYQRFFLPMTRTVLGPGDGQWQFGTPLHAVAGPGTSVFAALQRVGGCGIAGSMTISGHFVTDQG